MGPGYPRRRCRSRAVVLILSITGRFIAVRIIPVGPSFRPDKAVDVAMDVVYSRIGSPGPAQGGIVDRSVAGQHAVIKNESIRVAGWCRGRRYMGILFTVYMTFGKPGGGGAKDKVIGAFYIAVLIILPAVLTV